MLLNYITLQTEHPHLHQQQILAVQRKIDLVRLVCRLCPHKEDCDRQGGNPGSLVRL